MHSLLRRQLKRFFGDGFEPAEAKLRAFIEAVDNAYREFDTDRSMLERSLDLSSQELLQSNSEMRAVFQALPDLVFRVDQGGTILSLKAGSRDDLTVPPGSLPGRKVQDIPDAQVGELFREALQRVSQTRSIVNVEYSLQIRGEDCYYEARLVPLIENQILLLIRNITEHKQAEEALRQAELKYRGIIENSLEGIFQCTLEGRLVTANPALARMLGYATPDELMTAVEDMFRQLIVEPAQQEVYVRQLRGHGVVRGFECRLRRRDGGTVWGSFYTRAAHDSSGQPLYYEGMVEDVSERKQLEERYLQSQKMEAFGQLAGGIAHDFNNLLTVIQGNTNLLQAGALSGEDQVSTLHEINEAAERAANLTRQLLTFSRRQPMRSQNLDLNEVVASTARMLRRLIGEHIVLEARFAAESPLVHADPGMLTQLLVNLAVNSRDAMPRGGKLVIDTAVLDADEVPSRATVPAGAGQFVRLSVSDTGCGIPLQHRAHIFEPFFTTKEVGKGTGLGLATVFGIVEQHRGWIDVDSRVEEGTTFHVYLPRLETAEQIPESPSEQVVRGGQETILLVEDESPVRGLIRRLLERVGYRVYEAASGVAALDVWREHRDRIDLLITDVVMPGGINGRELAERLVKDRPGLKVLFCSGYAEDMFGSDSRSADAFNFLEKPFDQKQFLQRVRQCIDQTRPGPSP